MSLRKTQSKQGRGGGSQPGDAPRDSTIPGPAGCLGRIGEVMSATGPLPLGLIALSIVLAAVLTANLAVAQIQPGETANEPHR